MLAGDGARGGDDGDDDAGRPGDDAANGDDDCAGRGGNDDDGGAPEGTESWGMTDGCGDDGAALGCTEGDDDDLGDDARCTEGWRRRRRCTGMHQRPARRRAT